ncbi:MAG: class I SAM-dependent methyltransferase [Alphaproteobacteria bacterium]
MSGDGDEAVRAQYEAYPYPQRDPADEAKRLIAGSPSELVELEHYVFDGRPVGAAFRALVAGGGTGDGTIMLAQQLADRGVGHVTYLDVSSASRATCEARATARGLTNIDFRSGSLLDVADMGVGPFDYVDCCGVLHHLDDPAAGLAALVSVLKPDGGLGLMLYGPYGRTGVYALQGALRRLTTDLAPAEKVARAKTLLAGLPKEHWFARNPYVGDHKVSDAGLYDLLLHSRDRAFTIDEIAELADGAGLRLTGLLPGAAYDPAGLIPDADLRKRARALPWLQRAALAEELAGSHKTHVFYAVRADNDAGGGADPAAPEVVPLLRRIDRTALVKALRQRPSFAAEVAGRRATVVLPQGAAALIDLFDGRRDLATIHRLLQAQQPVDRKAFDRLWLAVYRVLNDLDMLLISRPDLAR